MRSAIQAQHEMADMGVIVKASSGPRYVVSYRPNLPAAKVRAVGPKSVMLTSS